MSETLTFEKTHYYNTLKSGISLTAILHHGQESVECAARLDTGSSHCIFKRAHGELLGLDIESTVAENIATVTGSFQAYPHTVTVAPPMNEPRIKAKITFLSAAEGGRDVPPANLASGQYRPHIVMDFHQPTGVATDNPEETYLGVMFENGPAQIVPGQPFLADLVLMYWPNIKYEGLVPGASFTIREGAHTVGYGRVESGPTKANSEHSDEDEVDKTSTAQS